MYTKINKCRICGNKDLASILNLGNQYLTGVFPKTRLHSLTSGPLELVKCLEKNNSQNCGLVQLGHSYRHTEMYGDNYGYRSGLNQSMVEHLNKKAKTIESLAKLHKGDLVIDIGSNDGTLLKSYITDGLLLAGVDPSGAKFKEYYPGNITLVADYFSAECVKANFNGRKAKAVTSIAMFYDLESPLDFALQVKEVLDDEGIWLFEQSYLPAMLEMNSYDTVCHEHLEYYGLKQIKWITDNAGFKIIGIEFNNVNGGSFSVAVAKEKSHYRQNAQVVQSALENEMSIGLHTLVPFERFRARVAEHREKLLSSIREFKIAKKKIFGYGASTKGNVILQYCGITEDDIPYIAEVNPDKFGCFTPGSGIPIISEEETRQMRPDCFMVLPWHFRDNIIKREKSYLAGGGRLLFPLPILELV